MTRWIELEIPHFPDSGSEVCTSRAESNLSLQVRATIFKGLRCLQVVQVGNDIELDTVGRQFEPYRWHPCGVTWDAVPEQSWLLKLWRNSAFPSQVRLGVTVGVQCNTRHLEWHNNNQDWLMAIPRTGELCDSERHWLCPKNIHKTSWWIELEIPNFPGIFHQIICCC